MHCWRTPKGKAIEALNKKPLWSWNYRLICSVLQIKYLVTYYFFSTTSSPQFIKQSHCKKWFWDWLMKLYATLNRILPRGSDKNYAKLSEARFTGLVKYKWDKTYHLWLTNMNTLPYTVGGEDIRLSGS